MLKEQDASIITGTTGFKNPNEANQYSAGLSGMNKTGFAYHWIIATLSDNTPVGFCNIYLPAPHLLHLKNCEVSFGLSPAVRGNGYMKESLEACLAFIFQNEGFERVEAYVSPTNLASMSLLEGLGFNQEGLQHQKWRIGNERHDMFMYALLAKAFV